MIKFEARYFNNAHRISDVKLDPGVTTLYDGQWLCAGASGFVLSTGTTNKKSYFCISSKYGNPVSNIGRAITAGPSGRDNVTSTGYVSVLVGPFRVETDQWETGTYNLGAALKVSANAKLTPWVQGTDKAEDIVGYVFKAPASAADTLGFVHE